MDVQKFVDRFLGTKVGDGQCVAVFRRWILDPDGWGLPEPLEGLGADGGAEGLYYRYGYDVGPKSRRYLDLYQYTEASQRPMPGDAVIFKASPSNRFGHVGICIGLDENRDILLLEQNGIAAMAGKDVEAKTGTWGTERVLGWLRKRGG